jgi:hypothetical protein
MGICDGSSYPGKGTTTDSHAGRYVQTSKEVPTTGRSQAGQANKRRSSESDFGEDSGS